MRIWEGHHDRAVKFALCFVNQVFVQTAPSGWRAVEPCYGLIDVDCRLLDGCRRLLGDIRFYPINLVADVDAVGYGALMVVFHDEVLVEEPDGLLGGRGGEADDEGYRSIRAPAARDRRWSGDTRR